MTLASERVAPATERLLEVALREALSTGRSQIEPIHALDYIEGLLNTSDRSRYSFNEEQAAEIVTKLHQAVDQLGAAYAGQRKTRVRVDL